ncbi:PSD1 and planctomycete cytochrome C domain-containing protein [Paludisphaera borealis]|uniref:Cytochrome c domain-containing protein n=1 Tax=Paludisphaera borealis TaxID=1387353 RepID=A0A1U7CJ08_9BACT|nr:PSD1 and planctomycete cytochrome C domain-containing protein [Paludisphaera borealis]APW58925.1 hypothetical protein BSF38_00337 [Paludisphaera borealis]
MDVVARTRSRLLVAAFLALAIVSSSRTTSAGEPGEAKAEADRARFFEQKVRPLLAEKCYSCHGPDKQKGGLRLDSREAALKGGETGAAVAPGKPEASPLVAAVRYEDLEMPPTGKLEADQIAILAQWVEQGAFWTPGATTAGTKPGPASPVDRELWSFQPLRDIQPEGPDAPAPWAAWSRNPIDRFVLGAMLDKGLTPAAEASKRTLIRRVAFDLTGLPPTPEEIDRFLADAAPDAYDRLVDRLLASPQYGERWGRHWLDLVRYAESDGHNADAYRPDAWRYRDYVVRSLNADKPYNRFLTEQLAGDELDPGDPDLRIATGYLRLGPYEANQRNVRGQWTDILNEMTDVTGEVFLGLSIGCARCHDHKFDPILQKDYYRLQAFFTPILPIDGLSVATASETSDYKAKRAEWEKATAEIRAKLDAIERPIREQEDATAIVKFPDDVKAMLARPEAERTPLEAQLAALAFRQITLERDKPLTAAKIAKPDRERWQALVGDLKKFDAIKPAEPAKALGVGDVGPSAPPTTIPGARKTEEIAPGYLTALAPAPAAVPAPVNAPRSTGRRLALANWLSRPDNPLSTRVIVNRIWQYHFGRGLVGTSNDFGKVGDAPSHPELLDWLARRFVADGWRLKPLHRLILTSAAYRQSSERSESEVESARLIDPEVRLLWKQTVQRLEAEEVRDAMLAVSGELTAAASGPSVDPKTPLRSVVAKVMRNTHDPVLEVFDAPDGFTSAGRRNVSTTPVQALLLINGSWTLARAKAMAGRLDRLTAEASGDRDQARIAWAYRLAFGRQPEADELADGLAFLRRPDPREALVDYCHVLLNSNEFLYVD